MKKKKLLITLNMVRCTMIVVDEEHGYREPLHNEDVGTECQRTTTPDEYSYYLLSILWHSSRQELAERLGRTPMLEQTIFTNYLEPLGGGWPPLAFAEETAKAV